ncbi:MAG: hypothetical protein L0170_01365, partial [Acidobacteria bacterium]|nr:hypothetical protein [Acidobacteriota bacterium]
MPIEDVISRDDPDLVELSPGQWVGADQNFLLFSPVLSKRGLGPDCVRVRLALFLVPAKLGGNATLEIEAHRTGL